MQPELAAVGSRFYSVSCCQHASHRSCNCLSCQHLYISYALHSDHCKKDHSDTCQCFSSPSFPTFPPFPYPIHLRYPSRHDIRLCKRTVSSCAARPHVPLRHETPLTTNNSPCLNCSSAPHTRRYPCPTVRRPDRPAHERASYNRPSIFGYISR